METVGPESRVRWVGLIAIWASIAAAAALRLGVDPGADAALLGQGETGAADAEVSAQAEPNAGAEVSAPATLSPSAEPALASTANASAGELRPAAISPTPQPRRRYRRRDRYWLDMPYSPANWSPPEGPVRIGLQAGHWRADEAPDELAGLRDNGTRIEGKAEWEVNLAIARQAAEMLEALGYVVDVLPAVVPPGYRAHLFISIHADGSRDAGASGYRVASPRRDVTGRAQGAAALLERSYGEATGIQRIPTVTRRMRNYYAFNFYRYQHALHPLTVGVILETGFLTSASDRRVIVDDPARAARGIVAAVTAFPETPPPRVELTVATGGAQ